MKVAHLFTEHPHSVGETYGQHLRVAGRFGLRMVLAGGACLVHALLPFLFCSTGSRTISELNEQMTRRRGTLPPREQAARDSRVEVPALHG